MKKENQYQKMFSQKLLYKTEEERKRIASDLHDSISHELITLKTAINTNTENYRNQIDNILEEVRVISRNLSPILFENLGLELSIEQMVERIQIQNKFLITADIKYNKSLATNDELQLYRIIQEATNNMIKYSKAIAGKITIIENDTNINIEIKDNGIGFNVDEAVNSGASFGLYNIIERSKVINGETKIHSDEKGTIVTINIKKKK